MNRIQFTDVKIKVQNFDVRVEGVEKICSAKIFFVIFLLTIYQI